MPTLFSTTTALAVLMTLFVPGRGQFDCTCNNFLWNNNGVIVGSCQSLDVDGLPVCYLNQPNQCVDAMTSRRFCNMQVTKIGCGCTLNSDGSACRRPSLLSTLLLGGRLTRSVDGDDKPFTLGPDGQGDW